MLRTSSRVLASFPKLSVPGTPLFLIKQPSIMATSVRVVHSGQQAVIEQATRSRSRSLWLGAAAAAGVFAIGAVGSLMVEGSPVGGNGRWPDSVRQRIHDTYTALGSGIAVTAASAVVCARIPRLGQFAVTSPWLMLGATIGTMFVAMAVPKDNKVAKVGAFALFNSAIGLSLAPLALLGGPIIFKAAAYTGAMVGSLSFVAATSPSERFLYLGGPLVMGLGAVVVASLGSLLLPATGAALAYSVSLYGGLALFSGFVLYDTSNVIHRAETAPAGSWDPYNESLSIYLDTINIFVRMAAILGGNQQRRK